MSATDSADNIEGKPEYNGPMEPPVFFLARRNGKVLGTCFAVGENLLATAAHVLGGSDEDLVVGVSTGLTRRTYQRLDQPFNVVGARSVNIDPYRDLAILEAKDLSVATPHTLGSSDDVLPSDGIATWGFPHAGDDRVVLTVQRSHVGARYVRGTGEDETKFMVVNLVLRDGQSGSPVTSENGTVVGVLNGSYRNPNGAGVFIDNMDALALHQTGIAVSAEYLQEMLL